jgi:hypothetical protein
MGTGSGRLGLDPPILNGTGDRKLALADGPAEGDFGATLP